MKVQTLKGFRDFLPQQAKKRQYVIEVLKKVFESYGFFPLETPALEYEDILLGKYGEEGDKLMYRFTDLGGRRVALRYDQTVPLARVVAQYQNELPIPFKRYQIQPVWRAENTQKGRFREFMQCDIDTIGSTSLMADAEIIVCVLNCIKKLGFNRVKILINDRSVFSDLKPEFVAAIDKLEKIGESAVVGELIGKGMEKYAAEKLVNSFNNIKPTENIQIVCNYLKKLGLNEKDYLFKPSLARGLNYYTGTIFELVSDSYKSGSLGGGGRYDKLIGMFAARDIPAVGFAFGFDRIMEAMGELNLFPKDLISTKVLVTIFSPELLNDSIEVSSRLRSNNIAAELYLDPNKKLETQLKYANKKGIPWVIIIGPEEKAKNLIKVKNLQDGSQKQISLQEFVSDIKK